MAALRIAANDPGLAHGVARAGIDALASKSAALYQRLNGKAPRDISKILRRHFGDLLLHEELDHGRRNHGTSIWLALDADRDGEGMEPLRVKLARCHRVMSLDVTAYRLRISAHCLARILQRTVGVGDLRAAGSLLLDHVAQAANLIDAGQVRGGDNVQTSTPEGVVLWTTRRNVDGKLLLIGRTWVSSTMTTAEQAAACNQYAAVVTRRRKRIAQ